MNNYINEDKKRLSDLAKELGFSNKSFLVSGATGMIGKIFVDVLLEITNPSNIIVMGKDIDECNRLFGNKGVEFSSFDTLNCINKHVDYVVHLASPTNSKYLSERPVEVIDFMYSSTRAILDFGNRVDSSVLFISSMEAYGEIHDEKTKKESELGYISLESTRSSYPESKRICELLIKSYSNEYGLKCYTARLAQTFGAGTPVDDSRIFGYFARCALNKQDIILKTKGDTFGNYTYIADTIASFFYILSNGKSGETYNVVGDGCRSTIYDMAELVAKKIADNSISVIVDENNSGQYPNSTKLNMSNKKLKSIGWRPKYNLLDMYRRMLDK